MREKSPRFIRGRSLRAQVFERDHGVCALCGLDTEALLAEIAKLRCDDVTRILMRSRVLREMGLPVTGSLWHADHALPVSEGGGACGIENLRTLCHKCHMDQTRALRGRQSLDARRDAKLAWGRRTREG